MKRLLFSTVACVAMLATASNQGRAELIININEVGADVVTVFSGTLDLSGLTFMGHGETKGFISPGGTVAQVVSGDASDEMQPIEQWGEVTDFPLAMGTGTTIVLADSATGDLGLGVVTIPSHGLSRVHVPDGYQSGDSLYVTMTHANHSFDSLGLTPGEYIWSWSTDFVVVNIGDPVVPEPSSVALLGVGVCCLVAGWRRRR